MFKNPSPLIHLAIRPANLRDVQDVAQKLSAEDREKLTKEYELAPEKVLTSFFHAFENAYTILDGKEGVGLIGIDPEDGTLFFIKASTGDKL